MLIICQPMKTLLWQITYSTFHTTSCRVFSLHPPGLPLMAMSQCFSVHLCSCIVSESYPRLSLSVSLGKVLGMVVRCLNVQWTSLTPGQLQLCGQGGLACMGEIYREDDNKRRSDGEGWGLNKSWGIMKQTKCINLVKIYLLTTSTFLRKCVQYYHIHPCCAFPYVRQIPLANLNFFFLIDDWWWNDAMLPWTLEENFWATCLCYPEIFQMVRFDRKWICLCTGLNEMKNRFFIYLCWCET